MGSDPTRWLRFGGGLNERDDFNIALEECASGENFDLNIDKRALTPRLPFDLAATAPNAGVINSLMQHIKRDDTQTQLVVSGNILYYWDGSTSFTTVLSVTASRLRGTQWLLDDLLITTDIGHNNVVGQWDGSAYSVLTHSISGVTDLYAKYGVQHQGRLWLANVKADATTTGHMVLASEFEALNFDNSVTPDSTSLTYSAPFYLLSPDLRPINGMVSFFGTLVVSTVDGRMFQITGNDATNYAIDEWYPGSSAVGTENMVNIGNDILYVKTDKIVESLRSTDAFGDISADDYSRWINTTMQAGDFTDAQMVYDQQQQRVYLFAVSEDNTADGFILVFDKHIHTRSEIQEDTGERLSPWMKWTTLMNNRLVTKSATYMRKPSSTQRRVYWGDASGNIYQMGGSGSGDGGSTAIVCKRRTRFLSELADIAGVPLVGRVEYRRDAAAAITLTADFADSRHSEAVTLTLKARDQIGVASFWGGNAFWGGDVYWGGGTQPAGVLQVSRQGFSIPGKVESGVFLEVSGSDTDTWEITRIGV